MPICYVTQVDQKAVRVEEGGIYNLELDVNQPDGDTNYIPEKVTTTNVETNESNGLKQGNMHSFNGDVRDISAKGTTSKTKPNGTQGSNKENDISRSYDNLSPPIRSPMNNVEMTLRKADSTNDNAGYIVTENNTECLVMQLRAKSVEMEIAPTD